MAPPTAAERDESYSRDLAPIYAVHVLKYASRKSTEALRNVFNLPIAFYEIQTEREKKHVRSVSREIK